MEKIIELKDICFAYENQEVLHNVNFTVSKGDIVAIVGPNGGGKSTLIKLILGLISPKFGSLSVFGKNPEQVRKKIGYVPQYLIFDEAFPVTVLDVVLMGRIDAHIAGPYRGKDRECAITALKKVSLENLAERPFSELSGGERQRVIIAQSLVSSPELLLLDEPTANVDSVVETQIYDLLKKLNEQITIVVVSHNLNVVTRHATHVACVNRTVSQFPMAELSESKLHSVYHGNMALLQHNHSCQVFDPTEALKAPHRAGETSGENK